MPRPEPDASPYQHAHADTSRRRFRLDRIDPADAPFSLGDREVDKARVDALAVALDDLQNRLFASRRQSVLVVLQGTDTSGKDGTVRAVFGRMSPLGVKAVGWQAPSAAERAHDFLWRIHQQVPAAGELVVFNRSHYEDVLVPVVEGQLDRRAALERCAHINAFERLLVASGTVVCKFMLHISRDEQRRRLQARLDDPDKRWKLAPEDLSARKRWDAYQAAYADVLSATGTSWAPWTVVPADSKTHRNLMVATVLHRRLKGLGLAYPPGNPSLAGRRIR